MIKKCPKCGEDFSIRGGFSKARIECYYCKPSSYGYINTNKEIDLVNYITDGFNSHAEWNHYPGILPGSKKLGHKETEKNRGFQRSIE